MNRAQKALLVLATLVLLLAFLWLKSCSDGREKAREAELQTRAREADAKAADARQIYHAQIHTDKEAIDNALAQLPDADLTDRQRARACSIWLRQHPGDHSTGC